jgi:hypothetical protein
MAPAAPSYASTPTNSTHLRRETLMDGHSELRSFGDVYTDETHVPEQYTRRTGYRQRVSLPPGRRGSAPWRAMPAFPVHSTSQVHNVSISDRWALVHIHALFQATTSDQLEVGDHQPVSDLYFFLERVFSPEGPCCLCAILTASLVSSASHVSAVRQPSHLSLAIQFQHLTQYLCKCLRFESYF